MLTCRYPTPTLVNATVPDVGTKNIRVPSSTSTAWKDLYLGQNTAAHTSNNRAYSVLNSLLHGIPNVDNMSTKYLSGSADVSCHGERLQGSVSMSHLDHYSYAELVVLPSSSPHLLVDVCVCALSLQKGLFCGQKKSHPCIQACVCRYKYKHNGKTK